MKARCCSPVGANKCHGMLGVGSESQTHVHSQGGFLQACGAARTGSAITLTSSPLPKISPQQWLLHLCPIIAAGLELPETFLLQHLHIHPSVPPPAKEAALTVAVLTRSGSSLIKKKKLIWNFEHRHSGFLNTAGLCPRLPAQMPAARHPQDSQQHPGALVRAAVPGRQPQGNGTIPKFIFLGQLRAAPAQTLP